MKPIGEMNRLELLHEFEQRLIKANYFNSLPYVTITDTELDQHSCVGCHPKAENCILCVDFEPYQGRFNKIVKYHILNKRVSKTEFETALKAISPNNIVSI